MAKRAVVHQVDVTLAGDYYQAQPTWVMRAETNYKLLYAFDGRLEGRRILREDFADHDVVNQAVIARTRCR